MSWGWGWGCTLCTQYTRTTLYIYTLTHSPPTHSSVHYRLSSLGTQISSYKRTVVETVEDADDITLMNLSELKKNPKLYK